MSNILSAKITADGKAFTKTLEQLQAQLKRFEDGLKKAGNAESFNRIQRAIDATKDRMKALSSVDTGNLGKGLDGLSGVLKGLEGDAGSLAKSLLAGLSGLPGFGTALSLMFKVVKDNLFATVDATKISEEAFKKYADQIDLVKASIDSLADSLQFLNALGTIDLKVKGLGELLDLQGQSVSQRQFTSDLTDEFYKLVDQRRQINADLKLTDEDREKALKDNQKAIDDIQKQIRESVQQERLILRRIALQKVEDQKEANKKAQEDYDKYVRETIARAKQLADFLDKFTIRSFNFDVDPRDSLQKTLKRAEDFINSALTDQRGFDLKINANVILEKVSLQNAQKLTDAISKSAAETASELNKAVQSAADKNPIRFKIQADKAEGEKRAREFFGALGLKSLAKQEESLLLPFQKDIINTANIVNVTLVPAFDSFFDSLLEGENPIKGFFEGLRKAIGSFVKEIGTAIVKALLLQAIFKAFNFGGGGFGDIFKGLLGFRASGGPVSAGGSYIVGEKGPELFVPNTGGRIVSNADINRGGIGNMAMQPIPVQVTGRISGNDIILVQTLATQSQRRLS